MSRSRDCSHHSCIVGAAMKSIVAIVLFLLLTSLMVNVVLVVDRSKMKTKLAEKDARAEEMAGMDPKLGYSAQLCSLEKPKEEMEDDNKMMEEIKDDNKMMEEMEDNKDVEKMKRDVDIEILPKKNCDNPTHAQCMAMLKPVDSFFSKLFGYSNKDEEEEAEKARIREKMSCLPTYKQCVALLTPRINSFM